MRDPRMHIELFPSGQQLAREQDRARFQVEHSISDWEKWCAPLVELAFSPGSLAVVEPPQELPEEYRRAFQAATQAVLQGSHDWDDATFFFLETSGRLVAKRVVDDPASWVRILTDAPWELSSEFVEAIPKECVDRHFDHLVKASSKPWVKSTQSVWEFDPEKVRELERRLDEKKAEGNWALAHELKRLHQMPDSLLIGIGNLCARAGAQTFVEWLRRLPHPILVELAISQQSELTILTDALRLCDKIDDSLLQVLLLKHLVECTEAIDDSLYGAAHSRMSLEPERRDRYAKELRDWREDEAMRHAERIVQILAGDAMQALTFSALRGFLSGRRRLSHRNDDFLFRKQVRAMLVSSLVKQKGLAHVLGSLLLEAEPTPSSLTTATIAMLEAPPDQVEAIDRERILLEYTKWVMSPGFYYPTEDNAETDLTWGIAAALAGVSDPKGRAARLLATVPYRDQGWQMDEEHIFQDKHRRAHIFTVTSMCVERLASINGALARGLFEQQWQRVHSWLRLTDESYERCEAYVLAHTWARLSLVSTEDIERIVTEQIPRFDELEWLLLALESLLPKLPTKALSPGIITVATGTASLLYTTWGRRLQVTQEARTKVAARFAALGITLATLQQGSS